MEIRSFRAPGWLGPVLLLLALAILPFALILGLVVTGIVLGASVMKALVPFPAEEKLEGRTEVVPKQERLSADSEIIDADYEIKDENEKDIRG